MQEHEEDNFKEIYSKILRAGRRTYFFDVRETKASDYYLTITESKKFTNEDGSYYPTIIRNIKSFCIKRILKTSLLT